MPAGKGLDFRRALGYRLPRSDGATAGRGESKLQSTEGRVVSGTSFAFLFRSWAEAPAVRSLLDALFDPIWSGPGVR